MYSEPGFSFSEVQVMEGDNDREGNGDGEGECLEEGSDDGLLGEVGRDLTPTADEDRGRTARVEVELMKPFCSGDTDSDGPKLSLVDRRRWFSPSISLSALRRASFSSLASLS